MKITVKELQPKLWKDLEAVFGAKGACGGCWCMFWRQEIGDKWEDRKGAENKSRFKRLVETRKAHGALAYVNGEPVGWVSFEKRTDLAKLNRAPSFKCDDADKVWSIPCFYIKAGFRQKGVAKSLLDFAVAAAKRKGASIIEGYPVKVPKTGKAIPAAFAWTGTQPMFEKAGFKTIGKRDGGKQRMRSQE